MNGLPHFDPPRLLRELTMRGVDFVVIGGLAAALLGSPRLTQDLDITYATDEGNLDALGAALIALEARLYGIHEDVPFVPDGRTLKNTELLTLQTSAGKLDLLAHPPGAPPYAELRGDAQRLDVGGFFVLVVSIDHLAAMKRTADRPKDRADLAELAAIKLRAEQSR